MGKKIRVGILSGGGDAPGINAVIRAIVRKGIGSFGYEILGIKDGWAGLLEGRYEPLDLSFLQVFFHVEVQSWGLLELTRSRPKQVRRES